jgi:gliding motility-associated protein GldM
VAGSKYEADMYLAVSPAASTPKMFVDDKSIELVEDAAGVKTGKVEFTVQGSDFSADGIANRTFKARIELHGKEYEQDIMYNIAQPVIRVATGHIPTLYMNCGNAVNIEVPALGAAYQPDFSATGAQILKGERPGSVTIIPSERRVIVGVSNNGVKIGNQEFEAKPIPRPHFEVYQGNSGINIREGVRGPSLTSIRVVAIAEEDFYREVPKDASFRIRSMEVVHARGTAPISRMTVTSENIELSGWRSQLRPGDNIVIEVKTVTRQTYLGTEEIVSLGTEIYRIPIN